MSRKITIIGAGSVGSTIAYSLSQEELASEIVMIDINKDKAEGEVMDIEQGTCFRESISIIAGDYPDARDSDIVIITSGIARKPGQTRIDLAQTNVNILKSITPQIVKEAPNALYVIVSNPVDIMTYVFTKISGLPELSDHRFWYDSGYSKTSLWIIRAASGSTKKYSCVCVWRAWRYFFHSVDRSLCIRCTCR